MKSLISVIVPIYKVENYIHKCIDSILSQTYSNLEIILVDDGSPDNCPQICDDYAIKDGRIKVVHKSNGGLSDARNAGMQVASGDYISFIDSDDYIASNMYELLLNRITEDDSDISICGVEMIWEEEKAPTKLTIDGSYLLDNKDAMYALLRETKIKQPVWNRLYKRKTVDGTFFAKGKYHEDVFWSYQAIAKAEKVSVIGTPCYFYLQRKGSIMGENFSVKRLDSLEGYKERLQFLEKNYPEFVEQERTSRYFFCMYLMQFAIRTKCNEAYDKILEYSKYFKPKKYNNIKITHKMWIYMSKVSFKNTCRLRNLLKIGV